MRKRAFLPVLSWVLLSLLLLPLLLAGCSKKAPEEKEEKQKIILYYINKSETGLQEYPYELENTEDPKAAVSEIIFHLSNTEDLGSDLYKRSIYEGMIINSKEIENGVLTIDFETNYQQLSQDKEILMRASIVKSMVQVDGIDSVVFTVDGNSLTGSDDKAIGSMTDESFILNRNELYKQSEKVTLYYANSKGNKLVEVEKRIEATGNMPLETAMILALIHDKGPQGTRNPLPAKLLVNSTLVYNNICYVDLSPEIQEIMPDVEDKIKIYSIVNTLASRRSVSQVQFTVDGKAMQELNEIENFDEPFFSDYSLAGKKKTKKKK